MSNILFIEDEKFWMEGFILELKDEHNQVTIAEDAEEAIRHLKKGKHDFDLIILDIMLPRGEAKDTPSIGKDIKTGQMGLEILRLFRKEMGCTTPVITLTAVTDTDTKRKALEYGVEAYLTKPISLSRFMKNVNSSLPIKKSPVMDKK